MVSVLFDVSSEIHLTLWEGECNMSSSDEGPSEMRDIGELLERSLL